MPKILVLSCGTGGGHNSAAHAIVEYYNEHNVPAEFQEYLNIINPKVAKLVNNLYISSTKGNGKIFKGVYKLGEIYDKTKISSPVYGLNRLSKQKLYKYIKENGFDYIITTHLFAAQSLTAIKKEYDLHFIEIATDYKCIPFWKETNPDYIIIPHKDLISDFTNKGFMEEKIKPFGIPVSTKFSKEYSKKELKKELELDQENNYILMMTGSMGFGNITSRIEKIEQKLPDNIKIIVSVGQNKKVLEILNEKYSKSSKVIALPYTNEIYKYMKVSEMILTKPGGLTTTESATVNIPIIYTDPIPGCENYNAKFFEERNMALNPQNDEELINDILLLLNNKKLQEEIKKSQRKNIDRLAVEKTCKFVLEETEKGE